MKRNPAHPGETSSATLEPGALLIVEDDAALGARLAQALEARGFRPTLAEGVSAARAAMAATDFTHALIDWRLKDGSGLDVAQALHAQHPEARIVLLTGYANLKGAVAAIRAGAFDCLPKPVDIDDVARTLLALPGCKPAPPSLTTSPHEVRWLHVQRVFEESGGNVSQTARRLSMHRRTLQRILARRPLERS